MCGGFLITEYNPDLKEYFIFGQEIETYKSNKDLAEKIKYYLANSDKRKRIAEAGHKKALKCHTYTRRFKVLFNKAWV